MKKILLFSFLVALLVVMTACGPKQVYTTPEGPITADKTAAGVEVETPEGQVTYTQGKTSDWCPEGASWDFAGVQGEKANWKIKGIVDYKGGKFCHVTYDVDGGEVEGAMPMSMEYYYSEGQKEIYMVVKDETGKVINEQHITG
jgi:hypothetical protein